ncbi:MAG: NigD-like C-terminal domain-containing protein [Ignavibacteriaceae bacterium]
MRTLSLFIMLILSFYYLSCNESNTVDNRSGINDMLFPEAGSMPVSNKILLAYGTDRNQYKVDPFRIEEAVITGNTINFKLTYSGGCREHDFLLVAFSRFLKSNPVQADLLLTHNSHNDGCEALITKTNLSFDLSPLKNEYGRLNNNMNGKIILNIFNDKESKQPLKVIYQLN